MDSLQGQVKNDLSVTFFIHTYDNVWYLSKITQKCTVAEFCMGIEW